MATRDAELYRLKVENAALRRDLASLRETQTLISGLRDETERAFMVSVTLLAKAAELHDEETGNHILRVDRYAAALAEQLSLPEAFCREIGYSAALHDVGKMSIDSALLRKRGLLTAEERREMELHTEYGWQILRQSDKLRMAADIARCHHERWDGTGYPRNLGGEDIPMPARIVALCDVYDALRSPRPYKEGMTHEEVRRRIETDEGHFDPRVRACFLEHHASFAAIYAELVDRLPERRDADAG